jgi:hypothetical protein
MKLAIFLTAAVMVVLAQSAASARTWHVPDDAPTIEAGIDSAAAGDTVMVECGTYYEYNLNVTKSGIFITSETGDPDCVTIDAEQRARVIRFSGVDSTTVLTGFTLTNGDAHNGGAMYINISQMRISDCVIKDNGASSSAGGINLNVSDATIKNCLFVDNDGGPLGGGIASYSSDVVIKNCTFAGNSASQGGHLYINGGDPILEYNVFAFADTGGAMFCTGTTPEHEYFIVYGNAGGDDPCGVSSNFLVSDPLFCYAENPVQPYAVHADSPCTPENNPWGVWIGAYEQGCPSSAEAASWSSIKCIFR